MVRSPLHGGKGEEAHASLDDFDPKEVEMGRIVEKEHTHCEGEEQIAGRDAIVLDHLVENPKYYTILKEAGLAEELNESDLFKVSIAFPVVEEIDDKIKNHLSKVNADALAVSTNTATPENEERLGFKKLTNDELHSVVSNGKIELDKMIGKHIAKHLVKSLRST